MSFIENNLIKRFVASIVFLLLYCGGLLLEGSIRVDHWVFIGLILFLMFFSFTTRKYLIGLSSWALFWWFYDSLKLLPNYLVNPVHVLEPYILEKALFGIKHQGLILLPVQYLQQYIYDPIIIFCGISYLLWIPIPFYFSWYLLRKDFSIGFDFGYAFLITNLLGFIIYYSYPAAPPWYYLKYGTEVILSTKGNAGLLVRFDEIFGINIFHSMYEKNSNIFAAIPSLHSSYPLISFFVCKEIRIYQICHLLYGIKLRNMVFSYLYTTSLYHRRNWRCCMCYDRLYSSTNIKASIFV